MKGALKFKKGALLFRRFGNANAQRQLKKTPMQKAPYRRGMWAFPYPYFEMFFAGHKFEQWLPKDGFFEPDLEDPNSLELYKKMSHKRQKSLYHKHMCNIWWSGPLYARFAPNGSSVDWYLYPIIKDYVIQLRKHLIEYKSRTYRIEAGRSMSVDHLEVFLPGK